MKSKFKAMIFGGAALLTMTAVSVWAEGSTETFLKTAIEGHITDVELGRMAQAKGYSQAVKDLGKAMESGHTIANTRAVALAMKLGVEVPTASTNADQEDIKKLATYHAKDFDTEFVDEVVERYGDTLELYKDEADNKDDGAVATYAADLIPGIQKHLDVAKSLDK